MKILIAEDEKSLNKIIAKRLHIENYATDSAFDGQEALDYIAVTSYDAILLDIMMPRIDCLTLLRQLRASGDETPVLLLTARDSVHDKVTGLDSGASDYLVKPFEFSELLARLRVLLRRHASSASNELRLADLRLNLKTYAVSRGGQDITLTAREFSLLSFLLQNTGLVVSRQQIQEHILDSSYDGISNMIDVYINALRKKIDRDYPIKLLHTIRGAGYVLKVPTKD